MQKILKHKAGVIAVVFVAVLSLAVLSEWSNDGRCAAYSREHSVKTRAASLNEWNSCQYFDGETWRSVHNDEPMEMLSWDAR